MISAFAIFVVTLAMVQPAVVYRSSPAELFLSQTSWAPSCPSGSGKIPRLIPHPYDCTILFICSKGVPKEYSCPRGHVFSAELQKCLKSKTCKTDINKKWPAFENCPDDGGDHYFPHPEDCAMFYQCGPLGVAFPKRCPGKLHYNPKVRVCDWPWNVNCTSNFFTLLSRQEIKPGGEI